MEYATLEQAIDANIIPFNNAQLITGEKLNIVLHSMVEELGQGYQYMGLVSPSSPAITTDAKVFVVAVTAGTYTNYGSLTVADGEIAILKYGTSWTKEHVTYGLTSALREKLTALPTAAEISASLAAKLNKPTGAVVGGTIPVFTEDGNGLVSTGYTEDYYAPQYLIGDLDDLTTEEKDEIVAAINEIVARIATLAEKDGYYPDMRVGLADNVSGSTATAEEFVSKASDADGFAEIASIKGQSVVWNQLAEVSDQTYTKNGITIVVANNVATMTGTATADITRVSFLAGNDIKMKTGHKYLNLMPRPIFIQDSGLGTLYQGFSPHAIVDYSKAEMTAGKVTLVATSGETVSASFPIGLCDLTLMFGAGNEPTTYEEFDRLYGGMSKAYNEGEIVSFAGTAIKTIGFNLWDEEWELGGISAQGEPTSSTTTIRSKSFIPVTPGTQLYFRFPSPSTNGITCYFYDSTKTFVRASLRNTPNGLIGTMLDNYAYMRIVVSASYGTTYKNDICINISGARNGQYEPYKGESTLALPELPEGGLRSAGSAYDALTPTKNITRIGAVDLGSLTWLKNGSEPQYYSTGISSLIARPVSTSVVANVLCSRYIALSRNAVDSSNGVGVSTAGNITIRDDRYPTLAEFQAAMSGVMLFYELATPIEVSVPIRNLIYKTYEGGTESVIPSDMPIKADINRSLNLPKDFISKASFDKFCTALGTAIGKTITATWDAASKSYNFTIV